MGTDAAAVLREALNLPDGQRADLAAELLASLPEPELDLDDSGWLREIEDRARAVLTGATAGEAWETVEQRLLAKYPEA